MQSLRPQVLSSTPQDAQAIKLFICPRFLTASVVELKSHQSRARGRHPGNSSFCSSEFSIPLMYTALLVMLLPTDTSSYHRKKSASSHLHDEFSFSSHNCCLPSIILVCLELIKYFQFAEQF